VISDDAVYVLAWNTNRPAEKQPFEDVVATATDLATEQAQRTAFAARVDEIRRQLLDAKAAGTDFSAAAKAQALTVKTVGPFSVNSADPEDIPFFSDIAPAVLPLHTGEITEPVHTANNTLIVHLAARTPGNPAETEAIKPDITRMMQSGRMRLHVAAWSEALLASARSKD
jgi:hypothetical protein